MEETLQPVTEPAAAYEPSASAEASPPRRRLWRRWIIGLVVAGYAYCAYALFGPADLAERGDLYTAFWYAAFLARTFLFHTGLVFVVVVLAALLTRQFRLAALSVPLLLYTLGPALFSVLGSSADPIARADVRLMTVNLLWRNEEPGPILAEIRDAAPDLLLLQEYTYVWHGAMNEALSADYPHRVCDPQRGPSGTAIYSKLPITARGDVAEELGPGMLSALRVTMAFGDREMLVYNVHVTPPRYGDVPQMRRALLALRERLESESRPMIVAGDFNYTERSAIHRGMLQVGLADAHEVAGTGRGATWPVYGYRRYLPGMRLDHVYVSAGLTATSCRTGTGLGSDHRPIVVDLALAGD